MIQHHDITMILCYHMIIICSHDYHVSGFRTINPFLLSRFCFSDSWAGLSRGQEPCCGNISSARWLAASTLPRRGDGVIGSSGHRIVRDSDFALDHQRPHWTLDIKWHQLFACYALDFLTRERGLRPMRIYWDIWGLLDDTWVWQHSMIACAVRFMDDWVKRKLEPGDFEKILLVTFETFQISSDLIRSHQISRRTLAPGCRTWPCSSIKCRSWRCQNDKGLIFPTFKNLWFILVHLQIQSDKFMKRQLRRANWAHGHGFIGQLCGSGVAHLRFMYLIPCHGIYTSQSWRRHGQHRQACVEGGNFNGSHSGDGKIW